MARKTVRVDVPTSSPESLISLGQAILKKHTADGDASPLDKDKMTKLAADLAIAVPQNQSAKDADAVAQKARQTRDQALGTADGQTAYTKDTALNLITYARDLLLARKRRCRPTVSMWWSAPPSRPRRRRRRRRLEP